MSLANPDPLYDRMEQHLDEWAVARQDVRAVVIIGSRARRDHPADAWSDLDCVVFVDDVQPFHQPEPWKTELEQRLGQPDFQPWFAAYELHSTGDPEWEIIFSKGLKLDLLFTPNRSDRGGAASLVDMLSGFPYQNVFERGLRVLVEKAPASEPLHVASINRPPALPTQAEFDNRIANYLLDLTRAAKLSSRGELWRAARAMNEELQSSILVLLEWLAHAQHGPDYDTWRYGRFLEEWIDPQAAARLPATYTDNTLPGIRRAMCAALDFLGWIGPQIVGRLQLRYPVEMVEPTDAWLRDTLSIQEE